MSLWVLGYPEAALADSANALKDAREVGQAVSLMYALLHTSPTYIHCGNYQTASVHLDELVALADEKGSAIWKAFGMLFKGCGLALAGKTFDAVQMISAGLTAFRSTGTTMWIPLYLSYLASAYA